VSQRQYEILFIAEQTLGEAEVDTLTATVKGFIEKENGTVEKVEKWGKKRLAYPIGKNREGSYVLMVANSPGSAISEVERRMRVTDGILRFLAVRIDAEMKKADRKKTIRGKKESTRRASVREKDRAFEGGAQ
jgi:small subunit ribosomal protein S6